MLSSSIGTVLINLVQFPSEARQRSKGSVVSEALPVSPETPQAIDPEKTLSSKTSSSQVLNPESRDVESKPSKIRKRTVRKLLSLSSVTGAQDKRVSVDIAIIKQSMERASLQIRWCPTELMVCDALTKDKADPADLLRAVLELGTYQLSSEASVLKAKKAQRERLKCRPLPPSGPRGSGPGY